MTRTIPRSRRRAVTILLATATVASLVGGALGSPASAAGLLASKTVMSATISEDASQVSLYAAVQIGNIKNGLGLTPTGSIHFTDDAGDDLGGGALPSCLLKPCSVSRVISTDLLSDHISQIYAVYSGDTLLKSSRAGAAVGFDRCGDEDVCDAYADGGNAILDAHSESDSGVILDSLGGPGLPCGVDNGGPVGNVSSYGLTASKEIYYMLEGAGAQAYDAMFNNGQFSDEVTPWWFCYVAPYPFQAYSVDGYSTTFPASDESFDYYGDAPQLNSGPYSGQYVGLLPSCSHSDGELPCIENYWLGQDEGSGVWDLSVYLEVPPGDPHFGGLKLPAIKLPSL
jgi:hypothetical protein